MQIKVTTIINSPPEKVRTTFLQFQKYSSWNSRFIKAIVILAPDKTPESLQPGDQLEVQIEMDKSKKSQVFTPVMVENSETDFKWKGTLLSDYIFCGTHWFKFEPTEDGTTKFSQLEDFTGVLSWPLFQFIRDDTEKGFIQFNEFLKAQVESE